MTPGLDRPPEPSTDRLLHLRQAWSRRFGSPTADPDERAGQAIIAAGCFTSAITNTVNGVSDWWWVGPWAAAIVLLQTPVLVWVGLNARHWGSRTAILRLLPMVLLVAPVHLYLSGGLEGPGIAAIWGFIGPLAAAVWLSGRETLLTLVLLVLGFALGLTGLAIWPISVPPYSAELVRTLAVANMAGFGLVAVIGIRFAAQHRLKLVAERDREVQRSEELLLNILPAAIAAELKVRPGRIAQSFDAVTVLFADVVGFTPLASQLPPETVVELLDDVFTRFDELAEQHGLEKIKTIGDAYMAVAGLPTPVADHAARAARMALGMQAAVRAANERTSHRLDLRIGLHTGPVVAGVIGKKKFAYDLWGDAVNVAARMESHGLPGELQLSATTAALLPETFELEERGMIEVKGRGAMRTLWLRGEKT
jgi:class 3 adenylate cyclase